MNDFEVLAKDLAVAAAHVEAVRQGDGTAGEYHRARRAEDSAMAKLLDASHDLTDRCANAEALVRALSKRLDRLGIGDNE
jgi:hypothetical protein